MEDNNCIVITVPNILEEDNEVIYNEIQRIMILYVY